MANAGRPRHDRGHDRQRILEVAVLGAIGPADLPVLHVHEHEAAGLQLGHAGILGIESIGAGRSAGDERTRDAGALDHRPRLNRLAHRRRGPRRARVERRGVRGLRRRTTAGRRT